MAGLDTNVLVRYLVQDDLEQLAIAQHLIANASSRLQIPITVILELEWVLRSRYKYDKDTIITTFTSLLAMSNVQIQHENAIEIAILLYFENKADFADCLHTAILQLNGDLPMYTFDKDASDIDGNLWLLSTF